ncbi:uncharacterized protein LOC128922094 [Zeugodacus cucurbitae]|uniref:uncharacterized protein LOC128922094 n=1 Tax=Zeugodacus cucurbitae TaxID=28588 RepID=UPI0023D9508C|nr:uncharacterized protein LOC128922094 [Zeugodacus cucurbitae]
MQSISETQFEYNSATQRNSVILSLKKSKMSKFFLLFLLLTVISCGLVLARPQAPSSATSSPSTGSTPNGGANTQTIRGAPCRGPPAVGQYKFNGFLAANKKK